jgi:hypothetical protein
MLRPVTALEITAVRKGVSHAHRFGRVVLRKSRTDRSVSTDQRIGYTGIERFFTTLIALAQSSPWSHHHITFIGNI